MHALLHSVAPTLHQATADPRLCQRLLDTHEQVSVSLLWGHCSFSWVLVCTSFCLCLPKVCFPVPSKFWQLYGRLMETFSKRAYAIPMSTTQEPLPPQQSTADPYLLRRHPNTVLSQSLGPGVHKVSLNPLSVSGGYGV